MSYRRLSIHLGPPRIWPSAIAYAYRMHRFKVTLYTLSTPSRPSSPELPPASGTAGLMDATSKAAACRSSVANNSPLKPSFISAYTGDLRKSYTAGQVYQLTNLPYFHAE